MFAKVRLLNGWTERLIYKVPSTLHNKLFTGSLVSVPLQKRTEIAYIESLEDTLPPEIQYAIKEISGHDPFINERSFITFIEQLAHYYGITPLVLYNRFCSFIKEKPSKFDDEITIEKPTESHAHVLTEEQQAVVDSISPYLVNNTFQPIVLQGVTGSGKTEVYHHLIEQNNSIGKSTLLVLPEVSLAIQFTELFKARFPHWPVYGFHSGTSSTEKKALWNHLKKDRPALIIGVHLPVLLPISTLGLIVIDEEHEVGYQEKKHPKINTKEAALMRAQLYKIPILLGSATPSISTLYNVKERNWKLLTLRKRFAGAFPEVKIVMLNAKQKRSHFWISKELETSIRDRLEKKEQVIVFLNRRGYSFFVQCTDCGFIFRCTACSVSLTLHEEGFLCCHYCGHKEHLKESCTACSSTDLIKKGIGTQQVVTILKRLFPQACIDRADHDSTVNRKKWQKTVTAFHNQEIDILVGTQTITKGYHFPHVTLVGILWADINLSIPSYNAAEITLQQLIQVAGRAGRYRPESLVIVQTMLNHSLLKYVSEVNYSSFYDSEIQARSEVRYPPIIRFAEIELRHEIEDILELESVRAADLIERSVADNALNVTVLGPAQPPVHKVKNIHIRKIYLKGGSVREFLSLYNLIKKTKHESSLFFTPNPLTF